MSWFRVLWSWVVLAVLMVVNGALRELFIRPVLGPDASRVASVVIGALLILAATSILFRPFADSTLRQLALVSAAIVLLTVAFEFSIGRWVTGASWAQLLGQYAFWRGELWPLLLFILALTPFMWGRWFTADSRHAH